MLLEPVDRGQCAEKSEVVRRGHRGPEVAKIHPYQDPGTLEFGEILEAPQLQLTTSLHHRSCPPESRSYRGGRHITMVLTCVISSLLNS